MSKVTIVKVHGLSELSEALRQMPKKLAGQALGASVKAGANFIMKVARDNVPVDTGAMKKAIVSYRKRGSRPDNITYQVGVTMKKKFHRKKKTGTVFRKDRWGEMQTAYYWRFVEFGTIKMAARPFLRPAFDTRAGEALAMIKLMLQKAVIIAADHVPKYRG